MNKVKEKKRRGKKKQEGKKTISWRLVSDGRHRVQTKCEIGKRRFRHLAKSELANEAELPRESESAKESERNPELI